MQWANGSAPVGEVKQFARFKKVRYYEKTENGCVEITASQYAEKRGVNNAQDYRQAYNEIDEAAYSDESRKGRNLRHSSVIRDNGNAEVLSRHSLGEELRNDAGGSISSVIGYNSSVSDSIEDIQYQQRTKTLTDREVFIQKILISNE